MIRSVYQKVVNGFLAETTTETCDKEDFSIRCPYSQNVLITQSKYGHIQVGRCIDEEFSSFGKLGCYANITDIVGRRCNGKSKCEFPFPDEEIEATKSCIKGLPMYLEVTYVCIPGEEQTMLLAGFSTEHLMQNVLRNFFFCFSIFNYSLHPSTLVHYDSLG